jgi:hypothetical protein
MDDSAAVLRRNCEKTERKLKLTIGEAVDLSVFKAGKTGKRGLDRRIFRDIVNANLSFICT